MTQSWICVTLVDITNTGIKHGDNKCRDQQRNWETVLQVLSLKTQPHLQDGPIKIEQVDLTITGMKKYFGDFYEGTHSVWGFRFYSDNDEVYSLDSLYEDFEQVPIILGLDETARFMLPIFHSYGTLKNIHFFTAKELNIS
jgi:hypothetical protein